MQLIMKNHMTFFSLLITIFINAQTKESDYFRFFKDGEKYLKLIKYVYFDSTISHNQKTRIEQKIYFYIDDESFSHKKNHQIDTCSITFLKKIKLSKPSGLQQDTYEYFKSKKKEQEKIMNNRFQILFPVKSFQNYVKVYVLEKNSSNKLIKYEVDWEDSMF